MSNYFSRTKSIKFEPAVDLEEDMIVWIKWDHYRHGNSPAKATPSRIVRIYSDGNILHNRRGYDDIEFAFARDIIAKSPDLNFDKMPYRTIKIDDIEDALYQFSLAEADNA